MSVYLYICSQICLSTCLSVPICLYICLSVPYMSVRLSVYLYICPRYVCLFVPYISVYLSTKCISICLSVYLSAVDNQTLHYSFPGLMMSRLLYLSRKHLKIIIRKTRTIVSGRNNNKLGGATNDPQPTQ